MLENCKRHTNIGTSVSDKRFKRYALFQKSVHFFFHINFGKPFHMKETKRIV